ncbi:hypothetical protein [Streptomyces longispororuber]|uniref:hypothetical protein n=1 Tax=Streptomyces longispororuber TaxID=68230 RepID=UPI0036FEA44B
MTEDVRLLALGLGAAAAGAALALYVRAYLARHRLGRRRAFLGLPEHAESLLVVNREAVGPELSVTRHDVLALLELAALVKGCGAHTQVVAHDADRQNFGERTEFCVGNPALHRRMAAHMHAMLPGVRVNADPEPGPDRGAFQVGTERYRMDPGVAEYALLARLTAGQEARPVFLFCGQRALANQAATRYLARHHQRLARKHGSGSFVLLLKVVNSQAYGPDVVELVADVTRAAQEPIPAPSGRASHRAK